MSPTITDGRAADHFTGAAHRRSQDQLELDQPARENTVPARTRTTDIVPDPVGSAGSADLPSSAGSAGSADLPSSVGSPGAAGSPAAAGSINFDLPARRAPLDAVSAGNALLDAIQLLGTSADQLPCRVEDCDLWFAEVPAELERAKNLCAACPIRQLCLEAALARREPWGVWGGSIFDHGAVIAQKRPRGRPRKQPAVEVAA